MTVEQLMEILKSRNPKEEVEINITGNASVKLMGVMTNRVKLENMTIKEFCETAGIGLEIFVSDNCTKIPVGECGEGFCTQCQFGRLEKCAEWLDKECEENEIS